jgi:hypothetical protein
VADGLHKDPDARQPAVRNRWSAWCLVQSDMGRPVDMIHRSSEWREY